MGTKLFYVFNGSEAKRKVLKNVSVINAIVCYQHSEDAVILKGLFDSESLRISLRDNLNSEDNEALKEFENFTKLIEGLHQVKLSWVEHSEPLQDKYSD